MDKDSPSWGPARQLSKQNNVVLGKLTGRTAVVSVAIVIGFAAAGAIAVVFYESFALLNFVAFTVMTIIFGLVFMSIAVGFSAAMQSPSRALYGAFGLFVLFQFAWGIISLALRYVFSGFSLPNFTQTPQRAMFFSSLNPQVAYSHAATALLPDLGMGATSNVPFYLDNWFGFVILALWLVAPIGPGYLRFAATDL